MIKKVLILSAILCFGLSSIAQVGISGQSKNKNLSLKSDYKRGIPPLLYIDMTFADDNKNYILEANESANLELKISNKGKGLAQGLVITVIDDNYDPNLIINNRYEIPFLKPDKSAQINIKLSARANIKSAEHKLTINVKEYFGYDMDPASLILTTLSYQFPQLQFVGHEIYDMGAGTMAIRQDGRIQAGEQVKVKLVIQNIGQNISKETKYEIKSKDENIFILDGKGALGDVLIGETKEIWITLSPNKRVTTKGVLPIYLNTSNSLSQSSLAASDKLSEANLTNFQVPISLDQQPPNIVTLEVKADIEKLNRQVARFEYTSNRINSNIGNVIDINQISPSKTKRENAVAVVIGIENYNYFVKAPYAENDASIMKEYFSKALGIDQVITYKSKDVTGYFFNNIFDPAFGELQKAVLIGKTDVFVFYSGHGIPNKEGNKVYLLPSDGRVEAIDLQGYELNKLFNQLEALKAKSVTVFLDACFSGISRTSENFEAQNLLSMKGVRIKPNVAEPWLTNPGFSIYTSSEYDQTSLGFDLSETGLFTYFLCAGLQGQADANNDNKITSGELGDYLNEKVTQTSIKIRGLQSPTFHGNRENILVEY